MKLRAQIQHDNESERPPNGFSLVMRVGVAPHLDIVLCEHKIRGEWVCWLHNLDAGGFSGGYYGREEFARGSFRRRIERFEQEYASTECRHGCYRTTAEMDAEQTRNQGFNE